MDIIIGFGMVFFGTLWAVCTVIDRIIVARTYRRAR